MTFCAIVYGGRIFAHPCQTQIDVQHFFQGAMMKLFVRTLLVALAALAVTSIAFGQTDTQGSKDYPGLTRPQNYYIDYYKELRFDSFSSGYWKMVVRRNKMLKDTITTSHTVTIPNETPRRELCPALWR
jgi:hypothetical protein